MKDKIIALHKKGYGLGEIIVELNTTYLKVKAVIEEYEHNAEPVTDK